MIHTCNNALFDLFEKDVNLENSELDKNIELNSPENNGFNDDFESTLNQNNEEDYESLAEAEDCTAVVDGNIFSDYVFYIHKSAAKVDGEPEKLRSQIKLQNGRIQSNLNDKVTHAVVGKM